MHRMQAAPITQMKQLGCMLDKHLLATLSLSAQMLFYAGAVNEASMRSMGLTVYCHGATNLARGKTKGRRRSRGHKTTVKTEPWDSYRTRERKQCESNNSLFTLSTLKTEGEVQGRGARGARESLPLSCFSKAGRAAGPQRHVSMRGPLKGATTAAGLCVLHHEQSGQCYILVFWRRRDGH